MVRLMVINCELSRNAPPQPAPQCRPPPRLLPAPPNPELLDPAPEPAAAGMRERRQPALLAETICTRRRHVRRVAQQHVDDVAARCAFARCTAPARAHSRRSGGARRRRVRGQRVAVRGGGRRAVVVARAREWAPHDVSSRVARAPATPTRATALAAQSPPPPPPPARTRPPASFEWRLVFSPQTGARRRARVTRAWR